MGMILFAIGWWLIGFGVFAATLHSFEKCVTVRTVIVSTVFGVVGPFNLIWYMAFANKPWLDKRIF